MSYNYKDGPECIDYMYAAFRRTCNPDACSNGFIKPPRITKWYKNVKLLETLPDEELIPIRDYLEDLELCPVCKQKINVWRVLISHCAANGQYSWFCNECKEWLYHFNWPCWHKIPAWKRDTKSYATEKQLFDYIFAHNPINIKNASIGLNWTYGKTRGAAMRLEEKDIITIEEKHDNNYKELVLSINEDYT